MHKTYHLTVNYTNYYLCQTSSVSSQAFNILYVSCEISELFHRGTEHHDPWHGRSAGRCVLNIFHHQPTKYNNFTAITDLLAKTADGIRNNMFRCSFVYSHRSHNQCELGH